MNRLRFVLNRRWAAYALVTVLFALGCLLLSRWQWSRLAEVRAENAQVSANWDAQPVPLRTVLPHREGWDDSDKWTPVRLEGRYIEQRQVLVRNRPLNGQPGFHVLTPLRLADGAVFVIDRGWVPTGSQHDVPDRVPAPPAGEVSVVVRLKEGEPTLANRSAPPGQLATIHLPTVAAGLDEPTYVNAYGVLASESPEPEERPVAQVRPPEDEGPHLSYALQWVAFGVMGFVGLGWAVRTEYRIVHAERPRERERADRRERRRRARGPSDSDEEDAILDRVG